MKRISLIIPLSLLLACSALAAGPNTNTTTWAFWWQAPTNQPSLSYYVPGTNQAYKLYGTPTLGTPMANWPLLAVWTNWTVSGDGKWFSNTFTLQATPYFFLLNPTNVWGETNFAVWAQTGPMLFPSSIGLGSGQ